MIVGVGTDLVDVRRIEASLVRFGDRFAARILSASELSKFSALSVHRANWLAKRFAAKEAVAKALGTGMGAGVRFQDISISNLERSGAPRVTLHGRTQEWADRRAVSACHLSLSDEREFAIAFVVLESASPG